MNRIALHVCCVGNFDLVAPPDAMIRVLIKRIIVPWMTEFGIPPKNIVGHRDYNKAKSCPGKLFDLEILRRMVQ